MFSIGVIAAALAAVAYGLSTVLRAQGAQEAATSTGSAAGSAGGALAAFRNPTFLIGTLMVMIGFGGGAIAARFLPLFLAQSIVAGNLVVTALLGTVMLHTALHARQWAAIALVVVSLFLLGLSASQEAKTHADMAFHWWLFGITVTVAIVGTVIMRALGDRGALFGGALSGLMYGALAVSVRVLLGVDPFDLERLLTDPAAWTIAIAGALAFYIQTLALQIGPVNAVTAVLVVGETGLPAIVGVLFLGDKAIDGLEWLAVVGFIGAIAGASLVAWFTTTGDEPGHESGDPAVAA
ncbi:hypothetical protein ACWDTD_14095 [Gordonia sp. NPDC003425]